MYKILCCKRKTNETEAEEIPMEELIISEETRPIWHITCVMDIICDCLDYTDLKSLRLVNNLFFNMSSKVFERRTAMKMNECLAEFNENYDSSHLKDFNTVRFEGITNIDLFEAFLMGKWVKVTEIHLKNAKFVDGQNYLKRYVLPMERMKRIKTLISKCSEVIIRTSSVPALERLEIVNKTSNDSQVILDGPISLIELKMSFHSDFIKNDEILSPIEWGKEPKLDFSRLTSLQIHREEVSFKFSVEKFLKLEKFELLINPLGNNGSRVIGWHNNLKIREIFFLGLEVNLDELPPSIKFCQFQLCRFSKCTPTNLKVMEIRSECAGVTLKNESNLLHHLIENVNLSRCKDLHTLSINTPRLNTSHLPSSLQYLRLMVGCEISGAMFTVPTLSIFDQYRHSKRRWSWNNDRAIDQILRHFSYDILHIDFNAARTFITRYSKSLQFQDLIQQLNHNGKTMYLSGANYATEKKVSDQGASDSGDEEDNLKRFEDSDFSNLVDRFAHYYEFTRGKGIAVSKNYFLNKVKHWENSKVQLCFSIVTN